jgi:hypothetical protein
LGLFGGKKKKKKGMLILCIEKITNCLASMATNVCIVVEKRVSVSIL